MGGQMPDYNATGGPQLTAEAEFRSLELVSWGQVWQQNYIGSSEGKKNRVRF